MRQGYFCAVLLAFAWILQPINSRAQMTMDAHWTVISNDGHTLKIELGIRTNTASENLGPATFIFAFDSTYARYKSCQWQTGFGPTVSAYSGPATGVTESPSDTMNIVLDFFTGTGASISDSVDYTPVVDIFFNILDNTKTTHITWDMAYDPISGFPTFASVDDDGFNQFSQGTFTGIGSQPLPVNLMGFSASLNNHKTILKWATASEINNHYFTVERSSDGVHFQPLLNIDGAGNSESKQYYTAYDEKPLPGISYYRLSQTDYNGRSEMFNMVSINNRSAEAGLIRESIGDGEPVLLISGLCSGIGRLTLMDMNGKIILAQDISVPSEGYTYRSATLNSLKPGIYLAELSNGGVTYHAKILIENH